MYMTLMSKIFMSKRNHLTRNIWFIKKIEDKQNIWKINEHNKKLFVVEDFFILVKSFFSVEINFQIMLHILIFIKDLLFGFSSGNTFW